MSDTEINRATARKLPPISNVKEDGLRTNQSGNRFAKSAKSPKPSSVSKTKLENEFKTAAPNGKTSRGRKLNKSKKNEDLLETNSQKPERNKRFSGSQEPLVVEENKNDLADNGLNLPIKPRKKRRKKAVSDEREEEKEPDIGLEAELCDLQEDVVVSGNIVAATHNHINPPIMRSEPINKLFIEQRNGFKSADKVKIARQRAETEQQMAAVPVTTYAKTTIQFALSSQRIFKTITKFFQGLFSGFALWQIVQTYTLSNQSTDDFLTNYYFLAWPVQSIYYFLFILSAVSAFDRYDISRPTSSCALKGITLQSGAVSCFLYFIGLVFSLSIAATDQKISLYEADNALWQNSQAVSEINTWRILNLIRGLMAILGWLMASTRPQTDRLTENLKKADENMLGEITLDIVRSSGV